MITVVPCAKKSIPGNATPALCSTSSTPRSNAGGVVSTFAVLTVCRPSAATAQTTMSVKVPPTSVATRSIGRDRRGQPFRRSTRRFILSCASSEPSWNVPHHLSSGTSPSPP